MWGYQEEETMMTANVSSAPGLLLSTSCALTHLVLITTPCKGLLSHFIHEKLRPREVKHSAYVYTVGT